MSEGHDASERTDSASWRRGDYLRLHLRSRVEIFKGSDEWAELVVEREFPVGETAILLCDVWDNHWCRGAVRRLEQMVGQMNAVVDAARERGVQIIHSPSGTMDFYVDTPYRQRIVNLPRVSPPPPRELLDPPLPVDASDGGCDCDPPDKPYKAWTRQHPAITIAGADVISDDGLEVYSLLASGGIKNLIVVGVHTNMCVLHRSFAIKQMTRWGVRCVLVRDLTDAMYNPRMPPHVSHVEGTDRVIEHIEKHWCPTVLSSFVSPVPSW
ncbi:MAG: isochorismatase family protein [Chloroflexi bacterium]|nr:isochorismatase family protein [Chloroflexota bacterium]